MRWDEGWSLGMASLPPPEILRITALDVHPPLYYFLLKVWLILGKSEYSLRFLSALIGILSIPLAYAVGKIWGGRQVGLLSALLVTFAPPLVYYSQVARMFGTSATAVLLATYGGLRLVKSSGAGSNSQHFFSATLFILGGAISLYTFYYTAPVLLALILYLLITARPRLKAILTYSATLGLLYLPWLLYSFPPLWERVISRSKAREPGDLFGLLREGFYSLSLAYGAAESLAYVVLVILLVGISFATIRRSAAILLPATALLLTLLGVALGAQAHMFAARYTVPAVPYLALLLGWALVTLRGWSKDLAALGLGFLALTALPSFSDYVYPKPLEVSGPFDPAADWRVLRESGTRNSDLVFFNVLSLAGTYERYRTSEDAPWSYALRWDPVIEPLDGITTRIATATQKSKRLWFVLYKGTYAANYDLKAYMDATFFPASGRWQGETLYLLYLAPSGPWQDSSPRARFENGMTLESARFNPAVTPGGEFGVELVWKAEAQLAQDYKVFVHLYDAEGRLVAQHDAFPVNDLRPPTSWQVGEEILDHHGVVIPENAPSTLRLVVGLYDPQTGERLTIDGADSLTIGEIRVQ